MTTITITHPTPDTRWPDRPDITVITLPAGDPGSSISNHLHHALNATRVDRRSTSRLDTLAALHTHHITTVIVDDAGHLPARALDWLHSCTHPTNTHLILAVRTTPHDDTTHWLSMWPTRQRQPHRLRYPPPPHTPAPPTWPTVPNSNFPWFRTDLHTTLTGDDLTLADTTYLHALHTTRHHLEQQQIPDGDDTLYAIRRLLVGVVHPDHVLTLIGGAAAAAFEHGIALTCNPQRIRRLFTNTLTALPTRTDRALTVIATAAGHTIADLLAVTVGDADTFTHTLPEHHQHIARQHTLIHTLIASHPDSPWLTTPTGQPPTPAALHQTLRRHHPGNPPKISPRLTPLTWSRHTSITAHRYRR